MRLASWLSDERETRSSFAQIVWDAGSSTQPSCAMSSIHSTQKAMRSRMVW